MAGLWRPGRRGGGSSMDLSTVYSYGISDEMLRYRLPTRSGPADLTVLDDTLADKLRARGETIVADALDFSEIRYRVEDRQEMRRFAPLAGVGAFGLAGTVDWITRPLPGDTADYVAVHNQLVPASLVLAGIAFGCSLLAVGWTFLRGWLDYTTTELEALTAAQVRWPRSKSDLRRYPNAELLTEEWSPDGHHLEGEAPLVWREPRLVAVAYGLVETMEETDVWRNDEVIDQQTRDRIAQTLDDINVRAYRIWRVHAETPNTGAARHMRDAANQAWPALVKKVSELAEYRKAVVDIDALHKEYTRLLAALAPDGGRAEKLLNALTVDAQRDDVVRSLPGAEAEASDELELVRASLQAQIGFLADSPLLRGGGSDLELPADKVGKR